MRETKGAIMGGRYPYSEKPEKISYFYYSMIFTGVYLALSALLIAVLYFIEWDPGAFVAAILLYSSGLAVGGKFYQKEGRAPEKSEKRWLALASFLIAILLSIPPIVILHLLGDSELAGAVETLSSSALAIGIVVLFLVVFPYLTLLWSIGQGAKHQIRAEEIRAKREAKKRAL